MKKAEAIKAYNDLCSELEQNILPIEDVIKVIKSKFGEDFCMSVYEEVEAMWTKLKSIHQNERWYLQVELLTRNIREDLDNPTFENAVGVRIFLRRLQKSLQGYEKIIKVVPMKMTFEEFYHENA